MATKQINEFTAVGASALTDQLLTETAANATRKCTLTQVFALLDDQAFTWTAAQAFGAAVTMATTLGVTGTATFGSTVGVTGTLTAGNLATGGTLASGAATLASLGVTGAATIGTTLGVTGAATLSSTLAAGASTLASLAVTAGATIGTTLGVTGAATLSSTLAVTGASTFGTAPGLSSAYFVGARSERATSGFAIIGETYGNPASAASNAWVGVVGIGGTKAGSAYGTTNSFGLQGFRGYTDHAGSGTVGTAVNFYAPASLNSGGGTVTTQYSFYAGTQTAGTTNWAYYAAGNASKFINGTLAPIQYGNSTSFRGSLGSNTTVGSYFGYLAEHDGTNWYARSTAAGLVRVTASNFAVYLDSSGLTADTTYTPTSMIDITTSSEGPKCFVGTAPVASSGSYAVGARKTMAATSGTRAAANFESVANPASTSTCVFSGAYGIAETDAACAQNLTTTTGLAGLRGGVIHAGTGAVTRAASIRASAITNTGGGTIATAVGIYVDAQTVGTANYAIETAGTTACLFGGAATFGGQINLKSYTVATLPSAATAGGAVYVSDAAVAPCVAFSNGTNWKRCDNAATTVT